MASKRETWKIAVTSFMELLGQIPHAGGTRLLLNVHACPCKGRARVMALQTRSAGSRRIAVEPGAARASSHRWRAIGALFLCRCLLPETDLHASWASWAE